MDLTTAVKSKVNSVDNLKEKDNRTRQASEGG